MPLKSRESTYIYVFQRYKYFLRIRFSENQYINSSVVG